MAQLLVIGSANMDVIAPLRRLPKPGETIPIDDVQLASGGKGANTAVAAARMGAQVRFVGCVGDDAFGQSLRAGLVADGIDCTHLQTFAGSSGVAVILLDQTSGQNSIMIGGGANRRLVLPDDAALFERTDAVLLQLETPIEVNLQAAACAREAGVSVILDPAPANPDLPDELLSLADILSPNESELASLSGRSVESFDDVRAAAQRLIERGVSQLVVKLGSRGAMWVTPDADQHVPAPRIDAVDTTAAGDTFTGTLAVGLAEGLAMPRAIERACVAASLACTRLGAQPAIPTRRQVDQWIDAATRQAAR